MKTPMTILAGFLLVLVALSIPPKSSSAVTINRNAQMAQEGEQFSVALESQISCGQNPDPIRAVRALQRAGILNRRSYHIYDSLSYFKTTKPLTVWGLRVVSVFGFDQDSRIFERGPGTAPSVTLGVVVPYSEARVRSVLSNLGLQNITVQRAVEIDLAPKRGRRPVLTEIYCTETYNQ